MPLPPLEQINLRLPNLDDISFADGRIARLLKSIYEVWIALKMWYQHFLDGAKRIGFVRSRFCDCMFMKGGKNIPAFLIAYVDDILLVGSQHDVDKEKPSIIKLFDVQDLG